MNDSILAACKSLDQLAELVLNAWGDDRTLTEVHGWHHPALTRHDLANIPKSLSEKLKKLNIDEINPDLQVEINKIPDKLAKLHGTTITHMFNGHGHQSVPAYMATLDWVKGIFHPLLEWQLATNPKAMPAHLANKLQNLKSQIDDISINKESLRSQISLINDATKTAESLPADLTALKQTKKEVDTIFQEAKIESNKIHQFIEISEKDQTHISNCKDETDKLVNLCEEAYRITTTKGLAGAFENRANRLSISMRIWVLGLLTALGVGSYIGAENLQILYTAMDGENKEMGIISTHLLVTLLSIGAPLWFAWLATKQIAQRFRLSEDYAYKASLAKAYEGYKKEAARIDTKLEARLFSSALNRLDEAPLRLLEEKIHGSPWHELVSSESFQNALNTVPELKDQFIQMLSKTK